MLGEFVDPSQHFQGGFSAGNECFGLLVLLETHTIRSEVKGRTVQ
jgi:hypothetical protein